MLVYKVTDLRNGRVYIGQTIRTLEVRRAYHYQMARYWRKRGRTQSAFANVLLSASEECFVWETIDFASTQEELNQLEAKHVKEYRSLIDQNGYNCMEGGGSAGKRSLVSRQKMSCSQTGTVQTVETRKHRSEVHRARLGLSPTLSLATISEIRFNPLDLSENALARKHGLTRQKLDALRERERGW